MVFQSFNLFPHLTVLENLTLAPIWVKRVPQQGGRGDRDALPRPRAHPRAGRQVPVAALRRPAAARGDRARAVHEAEADAVRRADLGARPGDDQGSARRDGRARARGHDDDGGDARDGLRAHRRRPRGVHGRRPHRRGRAAGGVSSARRRRTAPSCFSARYWDTKEEIACGCSCLP